MELLVYTVYSLWMSLDIFGPLGYNGRPPNKGHKNEWPCGPGGRGLNEPPSHPEDL